MSFRQKTMQKLGSLRGTSSSSSSAPCSGFPGDLSAEQEAALSELSTALANTLKTAEAKAFVERFGGHDRCLLRWLRNGKFDVAYSKKKFEETLKWRIEVGANDILNDKEAAKVVEKVKPFWPGTLVGVSPDGLPIQFIRIGQVKPQEIVQNYTEEELQKFYIYWMELMNDEQVKAIKAREQAGLDTLVCRGMIEVYDSTGMSVRQLHPGGLKMMTKMLSIGSIHYPENIHHGYIVNTPHIFSMGWKVISPVLNENARRIITVDSSPCETQLRELLGDAQYVKMLNSIAAVADDQLEPPPLEDDKLSMVERPQKSARPISAR